MNEHSDTARLAYEEPLLGFAASIVQEFIADASLPGLKPASASVKCSRDLWNRAVQANLDSIVMEGVSIISQEDRGRTGEGFELLILFENSCRIGFEVTQDATGLPITVSHIDIPDSDTELHALRRTISRSAPRLAQMSRFFENLLGRARLK